MRRAADIRFRVWDPTQQDYLNWGPANPLVDYEASEKATDDANGCLCVVEPDLNNLVFEQWTGLLDKDGRPIYEGDIVHCHYWLEDKLQNNLHGINPGVVEYVPRWATYYAVSKTADGSRCHSDLYCRPATGNKLEGRYTVLGNVHQHVHLLSS